MIKKFASAWNGDSTTSHVFGYLRNKHYLVNDAKIYYYFKIPNLIVYTCEVDKTWHDANRNTNQFTSTILYLDLQDRISSRWGWQFLAVDLGTTTLQLNSTDVGEMVVVVKWIASKPYTSLSTDPNDCSL